MSALQPVVDAVVDRCRRVKAPCTPVLAGYLARAALLTDEALAGDHAALVDAAARLATAAASEPMPSTLRMQAAYDEALAGAQRRLASLHARRDRRLEDLSAAVRAATASAASDYDQMQRLHRAVLTYAGIAGQAGSLSGPSSSAPGESAPGATIGRAGVGAGAAGLAAGGAGAGGGGGGAGGVAGAGRRLGGTLPAGGAASSAVAAAPSASGAGGAAGGGGAPSAADSAAAAAEVAAVVESVFPRSALKPFLDLSGEERMARLEEVSALCLGIRLFNGRQGRSTAPIADTPELAQHLAQRTATESSRVVEAARSACDAYAAALGQGPAALQAALDASGVEGADARKARAARWVRENANRRQLLAMASAVHADVGLALEHIAALREDIEAGVEELRRMVEGQASVPKSEVFPRFHALAEAWMAVEAEGEAVGVRAEALASLRPFAAPAVCSLGLAAARAARAAKTSPATLGGADSSSAGAQSVERLQLEATPEAMELPLSLLAQCPVLLAGVNLFEGADADADADDVSPGPGVLVTGDPSLGVLRWNHKQFVCSSEAASRAFMRRPAQTFEAALAAAAAAPELVRYLQVEAEVPAMDLGALIAAHAGPPPESSRVDRGDPVSSERVAMAAMLLPKPGSAAGGSAALLAMTDPGASLAATSAAGRKRDAGTDTPVHFVESRILPKYTSSEWELRRRALQAASLHNCATHSTQTDRSHFRRETDTQAWGRRSATVQTGVDAGTNPIHRKTFVVGMRGGAVPVPPRPSDSEAVATAKREATKEATRTRVKTVTLEYVP
ncbi:hypothetical protein FNF31_04896 [Cafeteria roenbergensis]|uniref:Cilia- and flagella-associated protein 206 n=1 Tax=Cafeteria roenbergensis TaxID=33653 RepID=A0A5A8D3X4_CAFRO|nr:hypothetical protein FNF31_04896 [Cafeteria roenbergensis]